MARRDTFYGRIKLYVDVRIDQTSPAQPSPVFLSVGHLLRGVTYRQVPPGVIVRPAVHARGKPT